MHVRDLSDARSRRRRLPLLSICTAVALGSTGVIAAQASAQSIRIPTACVVNTSSGVGSVPVIGTGFTPNDDIELTTTNGTAFGTVTAGTTGAFETTIPAPLLSSSGPAEAAFTMTAQDEDTPLATPPSATFNVANLAVLTRPSEAKPGKKVTFTFSGFVSGAQIYGHYLHGKKVTASTRFGKAAGACGTLKTKAKLYPGKQKYDSYNVQFDDSRKYSPASVPRVLYMLTVFRF